MKRFLKMSKCSLLYLGAILIIVGGLNVECSLFMVRTDLSLTDNYLYTSFVPIVSKIECAKFCSEDASCETATYNVTSRTCSLSSIQSVHDASGYLFSSASGTYVMSRFRYPGKTQLLLLLFKYLFLFSCVYFVLTVRKSSFLTNPKRKNTFFNPCNYISC